MKTLLLLALCYCSWVSADGINERTHPEPGSQAKINRVIAQAWATRQPPVDNITVIRNDPSQRKYLPNSSGLNLGLAVGTVNSTKNGQAPRENNVVTRDNIVICMHCQGGR